MGKRELAQIIAAQEWHDPTKWVSKKNKREDPEVHTADDKKRKTNVVDSVKKVRKSTETTRKTNTSSSANEKTRDKKEESQYLINLQLIIPTKL